MIEHAPAAPALVVSPHLDDAVLSAWSVLRRPGAVEVLNVFAGTPERGFVTRYDRLVGAEESAPHFEARIAEDREALGLAGRAPRNLGLLERQYRDGAPDRSSIAAAIAAEAPACSELFLPSGIGAHEDHLAVRDAGLELAAEGMPVVLYAELPYAIHKGWPHWVTGAERDPHLDPDSDWEHYLATVPCGRAALDPVAVTLTDAEADAKLAALRAYRTQFSSLNSGTVDRFGRRAVRRHEVFWRVGPADG